MNDIPKLADAIPYFTDDVGIFEFFNNPPWELAYPTDGNADILNTAYLGNHSGDKYVAPLVKRYWQANSESALNTTQIEKLVDIISVRYYNVWEHLWKAYITEYNPAYNYDMLEMETRNLANSTSSSGSDGDKGTISDSGTGSNSTQHTGNETITKSGGIDNAITGKMETVLQHDGNPVTTTHTGTQTGNNGIFGFNSSTAVPERTSSAENNLTDTVRDTSKQTTTVTPSEYKETQTFKDAKETRTPTLTDASSSTNSNTRTLNTTHTRSSSSSGTDTGTIQRERKGRFGLSLADELAKEFALWSDDFFDRVFQDIDKVLTLAVY